MRGRAVTQALEEPIAAGRSIGDVVCLADFARHHGCRRAQGFECGRRDDILADDRGRGAGALPDARCAQDARVGQVCGRQRVDQLFGACHLTGNAVADADRARRDGRIVRLHHIEMGVEGGNLIGFRETEAQFGGKRCEMASGYLAIGVLHEMQIFDQQVALARAGTEEQGDFGFGTRVRRTALWACAPRAATSGMRGPACRVHAALMRFFDGHPRPSPPARKRGAQSGGVPLAARISPAR